jgi:hypothetical protein
VSADLLRRAATRIREVAEAVPVDADEEPWFRVVKPADRFLTTRWDSFADADPEAAEYIALWHPAVALAVADWLENEAAWCEDLGADRDTRLVGPASTLARLILGEPA